MNHESESLWLQPREYVKLVLLASGGDTMFTLKIRRIGNSLGTTLPKEVLQKLKVTEGDSVFVTETADGVQLTAYDPEFEKAMSAYRKVSSKYRNALHELAK